MDNSDPTNAKDTRQPPIPWGPLAPVVKGAAAILAAAAAAFVYYQVGLNAGLAQATFGEQQLMALTQNLARSVGNEEDVVAQESGLERVRAVASAVDEQLLPRGKALLKQCDAPEAKNLAAILDRATTHCKSSATPPLAGVIPQRVSKTKPITDGKTTSLAKISRNAADSSYRVELARTDEPSAFAGVCWEFGRTLDLPDNGSFEVEMKNNAAGQYEFKFEKRRCEDGQNNLEVSLDAANEWTPVRIDLRRVRRDILADMARFCIATSSNLEGSPTRAVLAVRSGRVAPPATE